LGSGAHNQRARALDGNTQLLRREIYLYIYVVSGLSKSVETAFGEFFRNKDSCHVSILADKPSKTAID
jgi:hypothetical protein